MTINVEINVTPEQMPGVYANFGYINNSRYEVTLTFVCVDFSSDDDKPSVGQVIGRVRMNKQFAKEFHVFLGEHLSKMETIEDIQKLPERPEERPL